MDLIVFDLDGTLLNANSEISTYTKETLVRLAGKGIAYTVATGRALHGSRKVLASAEFRLPQVFKNGVLIWNPTDEDYSHHNFLTLSEIQHIVQAMIRQELTPFLFTLEPGGVHCVYHPPLKSEVEIQLAEDFKDRDGLAIYPAAQLPAEAEITNISALGLPHRVDAVDMMISDEPRLIAYAGTALEGADLKWIDIHHVEASKGNAAEVLRRELGASRVICFGDSDNDLSMFATADEAYAPSNAKPEVLSAATAVIGHHDQDGVARFLRQRFSLD